VNTKTEPPWPLASPFHLPKRKTPPIKASDAIYKQLRPALAEDVVEFNVRNKKQEMPFFGQDTFVKAEAMGPLTSYEYVEALAKCRRLTRTAELKG
jgi:hypothetical protein